MDLYCKRCGEPWDYYGVMHGDLTDEERERFRKGEGCPACYGKPVEKKPFRAELATVMEDILGDDLDGVACGNGRRRVPAGGRVLEIDRPPVS